MLEALAKFSEDYTSYIVIGTSFLTCYEFFKSRSWIVVVFVVAAVLFLVVVFHNPILNCLSGTTEVIGIYGYSLNPATRRINWRKLSVILGVPLAILLISRLFSLPWGQMIQAVLGADIAPTIITLIVEVSLCVIVAIVIGIFSTNPSRYYEEVPDEEYTWREAVSGLLVGFLSILNVFIFSFNIVVGITGVLGLKSDIVDLALLLASWFVVFTVSMCLFLTT